MCAYVCVSCVMRGVGVGAGSRRAPRSRCSLPWLHKRPTRCYLAPFERSNRVRRVASRCFRYIPIFSLSLHSRARGSFYAERLHHAHDRCTPIIKVCTRDGVTVRSDHGRRGPRRVTRAAAHASRVTHSESDPAPSLMVAVTGTRRVLGDQDDDDQREQRQSDDPQHHLVREGAAHHLADQRARTYVETKQKTRWDRLRPAGPSEAAFRVRPCLRLPRAPASLGQSAG